MKSNIKVKLKEIGSLGIGRHIVCDEHYATS